MDPKMLPVLYRAQNAILQKYSENAAFSTLSEVSESIMTFSFQLNKRSKSVLLPMTRNRNFKKAELVAQLGVLGLLHPRPMLAQVGTLCKIKHTYSLTRQCLQKSKFPSFVFQIFVLLTDVFDRKNLPTRYHLRKECMFCTVTKNPFHVPSIYGRNMEGIFLTDD